VDSNVGCRVGTLAVANAVGHVYVPRHVSDGNVAFLVPDRQRGLLRNRHVKIQADARFALAYPSWTYFVAVAIPHDFDANAFRNLLGIVLVPGIGFFLAGDANLGVVRRAHANVAAAVAYRDAGIRGNGFGRNLEVEIKTISPLPK